MREVRVEHIRLYMYDSEDSNASSRINELQQEGWSLQSSSVITHNTGYGTGRVLAGLTDNDLVNLLQKEYYLTCVFVRTPAGQVLYGANK